MLVPVLVVALLGNTPDGDVLAAIVFAVASLTDFVDGYLARSRGAITTFGKLMDPLADKLLMVAALLSLVSLHRLAAWVAMVIITRELAVTVLRVGATQAGVVVAASMFGKVKTCLQIAAILALIAVPCDPLGRAAGLRGGGRDGAVGPRLLLRAAPAAASPGAPRSRRAPQRTQAEPPRRDAAPATRAGGLAGGRVPVELGAQLAQHAVALGHHVVLVDRLEVLLARRDEAASSSSGKRASTPAIISRTQSSTKRGRRWAFSTTSTSSARFMSS